ncbi:MAG: stalk domain-containing protein [Defluviitaleaceae bacterium]|nr:stalk domain-containing protein [Defluviitaleaceae bacterium]
MKKFQAVVYVAVGLIIGLSFAFIPKVNADTTTKTLQASYSGIKIVVNSQQITPKDPNGNIVDPFIVDGTTYLPVRAVAEALGQPVTWDGSTETVYIGQAPTVTLAPTYMFDVIQAYDPVNSWGYQENTSFKMLGDIYTHGCSMDLTWGGAHAIYHLGGKYKTITGTIGHIDSSGTAFGTWDIYLDGTLYKEYKLTADMIPQNITIDVTGVQILKFTLSEHNNGSDFYGVYGIGNVAIQ